MPRKASPNNRRLKPIKAGPLKEALKEWEANRPKRCRATNRQGEQCKKPPMVGAAVCRFHGGAAPQVRIAAKVRLLELVWPAMAAIVESLNCDHAPTRLKAAMTILDRVGLSPELLMRVEHEHTHKLDPGREMLPDHVLTALIEMAKAHERGEIIDVQPDGVAGELGPAGEDPEGQAEQEA